jgi:hypothetical protein
MSATSRWPRTGSTLATTPSRPASYAASSTVSTSTSTTCEGIRRCSPSAPARRGCRRGWRTASKRCHSNRCRWAWVHRIRLTASSRTPACCHSTWGCCPSAASRVARCHTVCCSAMTSSTRPAVEVRPYASANRANRRRRSGGAGYRSHRRQVWSSRNGVMYSNHADRRPLIAAEGALARSQRGLARSVVKRRNPADRRASLRA